MSLKLEIPEVSIEYKLALADFLFALPEDKRDDFYKFLNLISGYCQNVEVSLSMHGLGGAKGIDELIANATGFELATIKEFFKFHLEGYSGGDFQHIFLDAYMSVRFEMLV